MGRTAAVRRSDDNTLCQHPRPERPPTPRFQHPPRVGSQVTSGRLGPQGVGQNGCSRGARKTQSRHLTHMISLNHVNRARLAHPDCGSSRMFAPLEGWCMPST
eukprot:scaffold47210_cov18-Phaeocystis_antarctica.AAC.1